MILEYWVQDEAAISEPNKKAEWFFSDTKETWLYCDWKWGT